MKWRGTDFYLIGNLLQLDNGSKVSKYRWEGAIFSNCKKVAEFIDGCVLSLMAHPNRS